MERTLFSKVLQGERRILRVRGSDNEEFGITARCRYSFGKANQRDELWDIDGWGLNSSQTMGRNRPCLARSRV